MILENEGLLDHVLTDGVPGRRFGAWVVDALILGAVVGVLWLMLVALGLATFGLAFPLLSLLPAVPFLYHAGCLASGAAATPGMALLGITARQDADVLARPTLGEAVVFTAGLYLTLAAGAVWLLVALITRRHRALHDLVSGLVIVRTQALTMVGGYGNMAPGAWTA
jgi:uncharacterized RDD family membrane protein YckC